MTTPTAFTFTINYDPSLGYDFTEQTNQGGSHGYTPSVETALDELFAMLYRLGHGNRTFMAMPELDLDDEHTICARCHGTRTIQPDFYSPPEPCPNCVDPDADERPAPSVIVFAELRDDPQTYDGEEPF